MKFNKILMILFAFAVLAVSVNAQSNETNETNETNTTVIQDFSLIVASPTNSVYNTTSVQVNVYSNLTLESLTLRKDSGSFETLCTNCSGYNQPIDFTNGSHMLTAKGLLEGVEKTADVNFSVVLPEIVNNTNATNGTNTTTPGNNTNTTLPPANISSNHTGNRTFAKGFQQLPKSVENGELTDAELADIIRNNKLNPGIINRLIKSGKLGNESMEAIIDTQFNPPGIFRKLLGWIGFKQKSYPELIYDNYNTTAKVDEKMLARDDLDKKIAAKVEEKIQRKLEQKIEKDEREGDNKGNGHEKSGNEIGRAHV